MKKAILLLLLCHFHSDASRHLYGQDARLMPVGEAIYPISIESNSLRVTIFRRPSQGNFSFRGNVYTGMKNCNCICNYTNFFANDHIIEAVNNSLLSAANAKNCVQILAIGDIVCKKKIIGSLQTRQ